MQDLDLKKRLLVRESDLSAAEKAYTDAAEHNGLYALALAAQAAEKHSPDPDGEQLRSLYSAGLVGRKNGRIKYDELKARAPFGRCLLCGNTEIGSLDHHLPKDSLPLYTICPANLVPACGKCNQAKGDRIGTTPSQRTLHLYYDRPGAAGRYLIADVPGWPVQFRIQPLPGWDAELSQRVAHHFRVFALAQRYMPSSPYRR
ncbi:hypothetical protein JIX56_00255 [Streptomyces sp. CA-210063]|uniref:HNH endonuclease n=1 Tax=Streptomyces sp. CA-210063 TaxID=2801029 RepID=UPI00214AEFC3|nr:hypothetical protein [Streptomyces sp. CA-210063]UUU28476.1 hypothetical protein JIX56_00255 [Streptomyces sp. CA-210063]